MMAGENRSNVEFARTFALAVQVRLRLEELESHPDEFAEFQSAFVRAVIALQDEEQISQVRHIIQRTYDEAVAEKLDAKSRGLGSVPRPRLGRFGAMLWIGGQPVMSKHC